MTAPDPAEVLAAKTKLTPRELAVLAYINPLMEANSRMIGNHIVPLFPKGGSNYTSVGAAICARLYKRGLVTSLPDINAWRITSLGRSVLEAAIVARRFEEE